MNKRIVLIGCGNIGSRHLQSLIRFGNSVFIDIVEPDLNSKKKALSILPKNSKLPKIQLPAQ